MKTYSVLLLILLLFQTAKSQLSAEDQRRWREEKREETRRRKKARREQREQSQRFNEEGPESQFNFTSAYEGFKTLFPSQAPRDVLEGGLSALKSTLVGGLVGTVAFLVCPFALIANLGLAWGLPVGALVGTLSGATVFVAGAASGLYQFLRGLKNTPSALHAAWKGKQWDAQSSSWEIYSLGAEWEELLSKNNRNRRVQDLSFYEILGVEPSATSKEIKKAYYQKAKVWHPDKNPNDEEAAAKFLILHEAYQTLSNDQRRAAYDQYGPSSSDQNHSDFYFNVDVFFEILFGLQQDIETYIGKLTVSTFVEQMVGLYRAGVLSEETWSLFQEESSQQARKRQVEIATNLVRRIDPYVQGKMSAVEFRASCRAEAERLADSVFGARFLEMIGKSLELEAGAFLNFRRVLVGWPVSVFLSAKRSQRRWSGRIHTLRKTWVVVKSFFEGMENTEGAEGKKKSTISSETIESMLPSLLEMAWAHNEYDIAYTLEMACLKVLRDVDASGPSQRSRRAQALLILGQEFVKHGKLQNNKNEDKTCDDVGMESRDIKARVEVAYYVATLKGPQSSKEDFEEMIQTRRSSMKE